MNAVISILATWFLVCETIPIAKEAVFIEIYDCDHMGVTLQGDNTFCFYTPSFDNFKPALVRRERQYGEPMANESVIANPTARGLYNNLGKVIDFYWYEWKRDSWDDDGSENVNGIHLGPQSGKVIDDAGSQVNNWHLYFPPSMPWIEGPINLMFYGHNKTGVSWATALDVVAHEYSHGVHWSTAGQYEIYPRSEEGRWSPNFVDEPLSVIENFCDVMAAVIDHYVGKDTGDVYSIFEDVRPGGLRLMSNPARDNDTDWYPERSVRLPDEPPDYEKNRYGYAYQTAGVANLAFYLLSEGGCHPNATKASWTGISVDGIGTQNAGKIWYDAIVGCMFPGAKIHSLRNCTISVASHKFKDSVNKAWEAVGVTSATKAD